MRNLVVESYRLLTDLLNSKRQGAFLDRPIFIWGVPRSGTTLLYQLLAKHPDIGYPRTDANKPREGTDIWWQWLGEHRGAIDSALARPKHVVRIRNEYAKILKAQNKLRILDKTPFFILWISLINKVFPQAIHFHIIRDGRAVVNSILYKLRYSERERDRLYQEGKLLFGPQPPELTDPMLLPPIQRHVQQWMLLVVHGQQNAALLGERYCELRYEDLVSDTRNYMKSALDHAQLEYDQQFLDEAFPKELTNRNYKWQSDIEIEVSDGYTGRRAIDENDMPYLAEMYPLLQSLGYQINE